MFQAIRQSKHNAQSNHTTTCKAQNVQERIPGSRYKMESSNAARHLGSKRRETPRERTSRGTLRGASRNRAMTALSRGAMASVAQKGLCDPRNPPGALPKVQAHRGSLLLRPVAEGLSPAPRSERRPSPLFAIASLHRLRPLARSLWQQTECAENTRSDRQSAPVEGRRRGPG